MKLAATGAAGYLGHVTMPYELALWSTKRLWALNLTKWAHPDWLEMSGLNIVVGRDKAKKELDSISSLHSKGSVDRFVREYRP